MREGHHGYGVSIEGGIFYHRTRNESPSMWDQWRRYMEYDPVMDNFKVRYRGPAPENCSDQIWDRDSAKEVMGPEAVEMFENFRNNYCPEIMD